MNGKGSQRKGALGERELCDILREYGSRKIVIDPRRTPNAHREFTEYEYMQTKDGQFLADVPDVNNHSIDAVRYALDRIINSAKNSA